MRKNNEIRFAIESDMKAAVDNLQRESFSDLVKSKFYSKIFLLGWNNLLQQLMKQQPKEVLLNLLKIKK
jgi:hypothetical protein